MGAIIKTLKVTGGVKEEILKLYFDSGSPFTFIKESSAKKIGRLFPLAEEREFKGIGNGKFKVCYATDISIILLDIKCPHLCYVVNDDLIREDILVGYDFMQRYDIKLDLRKHDIIVDKEGLERALIIK